MPRLHVFHQDLLDRLRAVPDVTAVGLVNWRPLGTMHISGDFSVEGRDGEAPFLVDKPAVSGGYFAAMGIRLSTVASSTARRRDWCSGGHCQPDRRQDLDPRKKCSAAASPCKPRPARKTG